MTVGAEGERQKMTKINENYVHHVCQHLHASSALLHSLFIIFSIFNISFNIISV